MSFILIKGTFHIKGYCPDGDSIRFQACDRDNWSKLFGPPVDLNAYGHAQLRMEAIDAPETHYNGYHQPLHLARPAARSLLSSLGIDEVVWDGFYSKVLYAEDGCEGYILARSTERNRRPVAFVFAGETEEKDGSEVLLECDLLKESLNYRLMDRGLVYPAYYNSLFSDLRIELTKAAKKAKMEGKGIWPSDKTNTGFTVSMDDLTEQFTIFPKLFRRIIEHTSAGGKIEGFKKFLAANCDPLVKIPLVNFTRLDAVVEIEGDHVRLAEAPEDLIFLDKVLCKERYPKA